MFRKKSWRKSKYNFSYGVAFLFAAIFAGIGAWALHASFADVPHGAVYVLVKYKYQDGTKFHNLGGATTRILQNSEASPNCLQPSAVTATSGVAIFTCPAGGEYMFFPTNPVTAAQHVAYSDSIYQWTGPQTMDANATPLVFLAFMKKTVNTPPTPVTLNVNNAGSATVQVGDRVSINWTAAQASSCNATEGINNGTNWAGPKGLSGSVVYNSVQTTGKFTFNLTCVAEGGSGSNIGKSTKSVVLTVNNKTAPSGGTGSNTSKKSGTPKTAPAKVNSTSADKTPPVKPASITVTSQDSKMYISWPAGSDDKGVKGYVLERTTDGIEWEALEDNISDTEYTDHSVEPDTYYFYRVRTVDTSDNQSETTTSQAVLSIKTAEASDEPDITSAAAEPKGGKKTSGASTAIKISGSVLVLALIACGIWLMRKRRQNNYEYFSNTAATPAVPATEEHTSVSLKDMVMQDYDPHNPRVDKPRDPRHPGPPTQ